MVDVLWVSECFFCLLAPLPSLVIRCNLWGAEGVSEGRGGGEIGSGGGYMAEFPRMLAQDEQDKEILCVFFFFLS